MAFAGAARCQSNPYLGSVTALSSPPAGVSANPYLGTVVFLNGVPSGLASARPSSGCVLGQEYFTTDTTQLYASSSAGSCTWTDISSVGGVSSFNGRTGAVTPQTGDYSAANVGLGNVPNVDATNAGNLSTGTVPCARQPALTG